MTTSPQAQAPSPSLPPSPHPRRRKKKPTDPFLDLNSAPFPSASPPSSPKAQDEAQEPQESLITRIIISPLLMLSFLLSLFYITTQNRRRRHTHNSTSTSPSSFFSYFSPSKWLNPEPYQSPTNSTWTRRDSAHVAPPSVLQNTMQDKRKRHGEERGEVKRWYLHRKIRKVARLEVGDAFEIRGRVLGGLVVLLVLLILGAFIGVRWVVRWLWG